MYFDLVLDASGSSRLLFLSASLFLGYLYCFIKNIQLKVPKTFSVIYSSYILVVLLSACLSGNYIDYTEILKRLVYFTFFILVYNFQTTIEKQKVIKGIILFLSVSIFFGLIQYLSLLITHSQDNLYAITSTYSHKNIFSSVLVLSIPFVLLVNKSTIYKISLLSITILNLVLLQSRSALLALVISFLFLVFHKIDFFKKRIFLISFAGLILTFISIVLLRQIGTVEYFTSILDFNNTDSLRSSTIIERIYLWKSSLMMFCDHYLIGVGVGNWAIYFPNYGLTLWRLRQGEVIMQRPHNDIFENFCESGVFGGLLFMTILIYPLVISIKNKKKVFITVGLISYCIISLFSFPQERVVPSLLFFVFVAYSINNQSSIMLKKWMLSLIPFILLIFSFFAFSNIKSEVHFKKYLLNLNEHTVEESISTLEKAKSALFVVDGTSTPIDWYIGRLYLKFNAVDLALSKFENALKINPYHIHILNSLGGCYLVKQEIQKAHKYFKNAVEIAPYYEDGLYNLAHSYHLLGDVNNAIFTLEKVYNKEDQKFDTRILIYAKKGIENQLSSTSKSDETIEILKNILSNTDWLKSIVSKSYENMVLFDQQLSDDVDYLLNSTLN